MAPWEPLRRGPAKAAVVLAILGSLGWPSWASAQEPDLRDFEPRDKSAPVSKPSKDTKPSDSKEPNKKDPASTPKPADAPASTSTTQGRATFDTIWKEYARRYAKTGDGYFAVPSYDPDYPSSRGMTLDQAMQKHTVTESVDRGPVTINTRKVAAIPRPEAEAVAMALPWVAPGQYGYVRSVYIEKILGPEEMIVRDIELIDATELKKEIELRKKGMTDSIEQNAVDRTYAERTKLADKQKEIAFRSTIVLRGYKTENLAEKTRWMGPNSGSGRIGMQVAVLRAVTELKAPGSGKTYKVPMRKLYEAVPAENLKEGITKEQFEEMLSQRGMTVSAFVELVERELRRDQKQAAARVVEQVEGLRTHKASEEQAPQAKPMFAAPPRTDMRGDRQW